MAFCKECHRRKVRANQRRAGRELARRGGRANMANAMFRHRQAVNSWARAGHSTIPWEAQAFLRGESDELLRLAQEGT